MSSVWRHHCMVGKGNVLKSLYRIFLGYINDPFLGLAVRRKKTGSPGLPCRYLFILVKRGKNLRSRRTKKLLVSFSMSWSRNIHSTDICARFKIIFNITIKSSIEFTVVELSLASVDFTTIPYCRSSFVRTFPFYCLRQCPQTQEGEEILEAKEK